MKNKILLNVICSFFLSVALLVGAFGQSANTSQSNQHNQKGLELYGQKQYEQAIEEFQKALKLNPKNVEAQNNIGFVLWKMKKYLESEQALLKTVSLDPKRAVAYLNLGDLYVDMKKLNEAIKAYEKYLELSETAKNAQEIKNKIEALKTSSVPESHAVRPELVLQLGHSGWVGSAVFSPDSKMLATGGTDGVKLWDTQTGELKRTLTGHSSMYSVAFSPDGMALASGEKYGTVELWDVQTGELKRTLERDDDVKATKVAFSPDGKTLASGGGEYQGTMNNWCSTNVKLWDVQTGELKRTLEVEGNTVTFSPDGLTLAIGSGVLDGGVKSMSETLPDGKIKLWDVRMGKLQHTLEGHASVVASVAFSPDGKTLVSGGEDRTVRLWDAQTGKLQHTLEGHVSVVTSVAFSPGGKMLASGSKDGMVKLWDKSSGRLLVTLLVLPASKEGEISTDWIVFTPEGYYDGSTGIEQFIRWRVENQLFPAEAYEQAFHRPDLVQEALQGK